MRLLLVSTLFAVLAGPYAATTHNHVQQTENPKVLILGGGVAGRPDSPARSLCIMISTGIAAAQVLCNQGVGFNIIEAEDELGGRLKSYRFGNKTVEAGGDSIEGTQKRWGTRAVSYVCPLTIEPGSGPSSPIFELAKSTVSRPSTLTSITASVGRSLSPCLYVFIPPSATFDSSGEVNFTAILDSAVGDFTALTVAAGARVQKNQTDLNARAGYVLSGAKRADDSHRQAAEYYQAYLLHRCRMRWITPSPV